MNEKDRIILYQQTLVSSLQAQQKEFQQQAAKREQALLAQIDGLHRQVEQLTQTIRSLEEVVRAGNDSLSKARQQVGYLSKLGKNPSEKIRPEQHGPTARKPADPTNGDTAADTPAAKQKTGAKERGNNNARRKEHFEIETIIEDVYPQEEGFDRALFKEILPPGKAIRYRLVPARIQKVVYHLHKYRYLDTVIQGKAPKAPLFKSNFEASFIAWILQMRYVYSMPVERIWKLLNESGLGISKSTLHGLVGKSAERFSYLKPVLRKAVLDSGYVHFDESYYTVLQPGVKNPEGKASSKVYVWSALSEGCKLIDFFYDNGSRARQVFTGYIGQGFTGAAQTDGYPVYSILETDAYPDALRLACLQHCKRKFEAISGNSDACAMVDLLNELYRMEHCMDELLGEDPPSEQVLAYKKKHAPPILKKIRKELLALQAQPTLLPRSSLAKAVNYTIGQLDALDNYTLRAEYRLDNKAIEREMRYLSLSRKNSMFCATHESMAGACVIYSLACSARLNKLNSFEYFTWLLNKLIDVNPNTSQQELRNLLPDRYNDNKG